MFMKIIEPGHRFSIESYPPSGTEIPTYNQRIHFFKKIGPEFPGNLGLEDTGTNCQELLRILISRAIYLDKQQPCIETKLIIHDLRESLRQFENLNLRIKSLPLISW